MFFRIKFICSLLYRIGNLGFSIFQILKLIIVHHRYEIESKPESYYENPYNHMTTGLNTNRQTALKGHYRQIVEKLKSYIEYLQ